MRSQQRAAAAIDAGRFDDEIVPLELKDRKGNITPYARDEHVRADTSIESLRKLAPVFSKEGTVTAGNSSGITDGAAAAIVMSEEALKESGVEPLARIVD